MIFNVTSFGKVSNLLTLVEELKELAKFFGDEKVSLEINPTKSGSNPVKKIKSKIS